MPDEVVGTEVDTTELNTGGAEGDTDDGGDDDGPVTFKSRAELVELVNKSVKSRVDRINKKYAPVVAERDTLKAKVEELTPIVEGQLSADQKREQSERQLREQVNELLGYQRHTERNELVRRIAKDKGLPEEFIPRIQGDDEDAIATDIEEFVALLPEKTNPPKVSKTTKPVTKHEGQGGGKGSAGGDGNDSDEPIDPQKLAASIGRYGRNPYIVK